MNWTDYKQRALRTVIYPKEYGLVYTTLGLVDEVRELFDSIGSDEEISEISDCCWYTACFSHECGIDMRTVERLTEELENYFSFHDVFDAASQMQGAASRIAGLVKKCIRDEKSQVNSDRRSKIEVELALIILSIYYVCNQSGTTFDYVINYNLDKLASRKQRGKLGGSGGRR